MSVATVLLAEKLLPAISKALGLVVSFDFLRDAESLLPLRRFCPILIQVKDGLDFVRFPKQGVSQKGLENISKTTWFFVMFTKSYKKITFKYFANLFFNRVIDGIKTSTSSFYDFSSCYELWFSAGLRIAFFSESILSYSVANNRWVILCYFRRYGWSYKEFPINCLTLTKYFLKFSKACQYMRAKTFGWNRGATHFLVSFGKLGNGYRLVQKLREYMSRHSCQQNQRDRQRFSPSQVMLYCEIPNSDTSNK